MSRFREGTLQGTGRSTTNSISRVRAFVFLALLILLAVPAEASAQEPFVVEEIRLEGLQRISAGTVFNYLPISVGDRIDSSRTAEAIRELFKTGFFRDVTVEREGNTLIIFLR